MQSIDFNIFARIITEMIRKCFFCWSAKVARNGLGGREQQYKCKDCDRRFRADGKQELRQLTASLPIAAIPVGCDVGLEPTTPRTTI